MGPESAFPLTSGDQGRIQGFHLGQRKRLCVGMHITSAKPEVPIREGSRVRLRALEALRVLMLSRAI